MTQTSRSTLGLLTHLKALGVKLRVRGARLAYEGPAPVLTPSVLGELAAKKNELLAVLSGSPYPSTVPGIVHDARGGVRVAAPCDLRSLCFEQARRRGWPAVALVHHPAQALAAGEAAWARFTAFAPIGEVAEAALMLDDLRT